MKQIAPFMFQFDYTSHRSRILRARHACNLFTSSLVYITYCVPRSQQLIKLLLLHIYCNDQGRRGPQQSFRWEVRPNGPNRYPSNAIIKYSDKQESSRLIFRNSHYSNLTTERGTISLKKKAISHITILEQCNKIDLP